MYRGFAFAQDAIADFVRSLDGPDRIALYAYSRDLFRASLLTPDRNAVLRGVRATTAGDDAALYNALLLTLKDAGHYRGRKVIVVFSNGPDNDSLVPPEDVGELAQSEGIPIYMISTRAAKLEPISTAVFGRMAPATGGEAYFAKSWKDEQQAFAAIRDDLAHLYALNYYPQANPNHGWRAITVKLVGERLKKYHIRTRSGYRPLPARALADTADIALSTTRPQRERREPMLTLRKSNRGNARISLSVSLYRRASSRGILEVADRAQFHFHHPLGQIQNNIFDHQSCAVGCT